MFKPTFTPTLEQQLVYSAATATQDNLLIQALAGAAKTSTLVGIAERLPGKPILCVAFNKRIADEMGKRLPPHCIAKTLNSIGHTAWGQALGKRLSVDSGKTADFIRGLDLSQAEKDLLRDVFGDVVALVGKAKSFGYVPEGLYREATRLISREDLEEALADFEYDSLAWALLDTLLVKSIREAYRGNIDFDDQLYMPTLFGAKFPQFPLTLVDEAQDLSPLNHQMIAALVGKRRIIAVGDTYQSIYGFRGAVSDGMNVLRQRFAMKEFFLTVSFRCPKAIIRMARSRAPDMQWSPSAIEGRVTRLIRGEPAFAPWGPDLFPRSCAVICRNNAPLFALGLKLISAGRPVAIRGADISKRLIKILREFGDLAMARAELLEHLARWREFKIAEKKLSDAAIDDRYSCLKVFAEATETLGQAIAHAEKLFASEGPIELLSGHKSKGLEWEHVFHLDPWRVPSKFATKGEALEQELNLEYVITTRSKNTLTLINLEDFNKEL